MCTDFYGYQSGMGKRLDIVLQIEIKVRKTKRGHPTSQISPVCYGVVKSEAVPIIQFYTLHFWQNKHLHIKPCVEFLQTAQS